MSHHLWAEICRHSRFSLRVVNILGIFILILSAQPLSSLAQDGTPPPPPEGAPNNEPAPPEETPVPEDWLTQVQADLALAEYNITWQDQTYLVDLPAAYQAPNRANNLRIYFAPDRLVLILRSWLDENPNPPWQTSLSLASWGRSGALSAALPAQLQSAGSSIEYRRPEVVELYRNDVEGLSQAFTFISPPSPAGSPLQLQLHITGDLEAALDGSGMMLEFKDNTGKAILNYGRLLASDSNGQVLPSWMELEGQDLSLFIDDSGAEYPFKIEALLYSLPTAADWSHVYSIPDSQFGGCVATAGDVNADGYSDVIIGVPFFDNGQVDEGLAVVYPGSADGIVDSYIWVKESNQVEAHYGSVVSTAGDVDGDGDSEIIVGATSYDDDFTDGGAAFVYYGSSAGLATVHGEYYQGQEDSAHLGISVASAGDVNDDGYGDIIIGASGQHDSFGQDSEGFAQVYYGSSTGLANTTSWRAEGEQAGAFLGYSVSGAGDVNGDGIGDVIVGARWYDDGQANEGKVFVWHGTAGGMPGTGTPSNANWSAQINQADAEFGHTVSSAGDVNGDGYADVLVGAPYYSNGQSSEGAVRLFLGSSTGLNTGYDNHDEGGQQNAAFGLALATAGDVNGDGYSDVMVGAPYYNSGFPTQGKAYLWLGSADSISPTRDWTVNGSGAVSMFGTSVATAGDVNGDGYSDIIVGAPGEAGYAGAAYAYYGEPDTLQGTAGWQEFSTVAGADFGSSVAAAGDVNADGFGDVIIGAPDWDNGQAGEGAAWVYLGSGSGLNSSSTWFKQSNQVNAFFGWSVGQAGDVNGDGYGDIIVGTPFYNNGQEDEGAAWVYHGNASGVDDSSSWFKDSDQAFAEFGYAVGTAGDVNGDGLSDIIVGAPLWQDGQTDEGGAWVYFGSTGGVHSPPDWYMQGGAEDANFGQAVGTAGDVNRDGFSDVIIGGPEWDNGQSDEGGAWVFTGSRIGLSMAAAWHQEGEQASASYGRSVGTAGDVNGDGFSDVIVGAPHWNGVHSDEGVAYVYHGSASGLSTSPAWTKRSNLLEAEYGWSVGTAGDVNGDGYADILVGAHFWTSGETQEGGAWVYEGSPSGVHSAPDWYAQGNQSFAWFGSAVASAGDVNGDAYADVIVGAWQYDNTVENEGAAFVFYGNGRKGIPLGLYQRRSGGYHIAQLGITTNEYFWVGMRHFNTFGRGEAKMQTESKALSAVFNGLSPTITTTVWFNLPTGSWHYTDAYPYEYEAPLGIPYHWRARLLYNPATTPFMPASRWFTIPWNGWNETKLRTFGASMYLPIAVKN